MCRYTTMKIWKFDSKKMLSVGLISKRLIPVEMYWLKIYFFFPVSVEITDAVEPYESLGEHPTEGGIELILPLFDRTEQLRKLGKVQYTT
jgi:hypothetical protein